MRKTKNMPPLIYFKNTNQQDIEEVYDWLMSVGVLPGKHADMRAYDGHFIFLGVYQGRINRYGSSVEAVYRFEAASTVEGFKELYWQHVKSLKKEKLEMLSRGEPTKAVS
jgi:hypothetical protein